MIKHCVHLFAKCYVIAHTTKLGQSLVGPIYIYNLGTQS